MDWKKAIKSLQAKAGLYKTVELCEATGIAQGTITAIGRGGNPSWDTVEKLAAVGGIKPSELVGMGEE